MRETIINLIVKCLNLINSYIYKYNKPVRLLMTVCLFKYGT